MEDEKKMSKAQRYRANRDDISIHVKPKGLKDRYKAAIAPTSMVASIQKHMEKTVEEHESKE